MALWAAEVWVATYEAALWIEQFVADNASAELDLASFTLIDKLASWHSVDDGNEVSAPANRARAPLAQSPARTHVAHGASSVVAERVTPQLLMDPRSSPKRYIHDRLVGISASKLLP